MKCISVLSMSRKRASGHIRQRPSKIDLFARTGYQCRGIDAGRRVPGRFFVWATIRLIPLLLKGIYGGPDALKQFVKTAHEHGIAVIVDVVYNHFGPNDLDLWQFDGWSENKKGWNLLLQ